MTVADIERIGAPQITRQDARKAFLEYRRAVLAETDPGRRQEYDGLTKGYKAIAAGKQVIDLHQTMMVAGLQHDTFYPRMAICPANASKCYVKMFQSGSAAFVADREYHWRLRKERKVELPATTFQPFRWTMQGYENRPARWRDEASALVPLVPAALHPKAHLRNYHILWDAVWTPEPPKDPLLLKHLAGHLYAIVAAWDLSPLERAVMRGRL